MFIVQHSVSDIDNCGIYVMHLSISSTNTNDSSSEGDLSLKYIGPMYTNMRN